MQSKSRVRGRRAGSECSQDSLPGSSLPPPSPLYPPGSPSSDLLAGFPQLASPEPGGGLLVGGSDPMLSMPPPSPVDCLLPTVLLVSCCPAGRRHSRAPHRHHRHVPLVTCFTTLLTTTACPPVCSTPVLTAALWSTLTDNLADLHARPTNPLILCLVH